MFAFGKPKQHFFPSIQKTKCISTNQNQTFSIILTKTTVNILDAFNTQKLYHFTYNDQHGFFKKMCWATNSLFIISKSIHTFLRHPKIISFLIESSKRKPLKYQKQSIQKILLKSIFKKFQK
eukprot:Anaeramoba_ignava/c17752_g1_i1.p1 GENE.c17752_g1_i1~~c17752_g1_i1.p1  ORF type:complete len:122 (-),score=35.58 c17752_g1_i1:86-451(-)